MQKRVIVSCSTFVIVATLAFAEDKSGETGLDVPAPSKAKEEKASAPETITYSARGVPVRELAETLGNVYGNEPSMRVVADSASNVLVIRADAKSREGILKLLEELDKPLQSMVVQLHLLKTRGKDLKPLDTKSLSGSKDDVLKKIKELERAGRIYVANRMELTVVENQKAMLQIGERVAVVTGQMMTPRGGPVANYTERDVGTLISVMTRASKDGSIAMQLQFEKSEVTMPEQKDDKKFQPSSMETISQQTTVVLRDGHCSLAATLVANSPDTGFEEAYLVVGAELLETNGAVRPILFRSFSRRQPAGGLSRPAPSRGAATGSERPDRLSAYTSYAKRIVEKYDSNKDGLLSKDEWKSMRSDPTAADANKDGKLSAEEYAKWIANRGAPSRGSLSTPRDPASRTKPSSRAEAAERFAKSLMERYDANSDGFIDQQENKKSSRDMSAADTDKDGKISVKELGAWLDTLRR